MRDFFLVIVVCVGFFACIAGLIGYNNSHPSPPEPRYIEVDGHRCRLYEEEVGQTSHGSPIMETKATCKCLDMEPIEP